MRSVAALLLVLLLGACGTEAAPESPPSAAPTPSTTAGWRTESWHRVQLEVPASWMLGFAPMRRPAGTALSCGVGPQPPERAVRSAPYVGRPVSGSDACRSGRPEGLDVPADVVWFGSPLPVGERAGARTVAVGGTRVTVAAEDPAVRDHILRSVRPVDVDAHGCPARKHLNRGWPTEGFGEVLHFAVCAYDGRDLVWSGQRGVADAERFVRAVDHGSPPRSWPRQLQTGQSVVLRVTADDPYGKGDAVVDYEVRFDPARIEVADGRVVALTPATVRPWASAGLRLYCAGPVPDAVASYFRPPLG